METTKIPIIGGSYFIVDRCRASALEALSWSMHDGYARHYHYEGNERFNVYAHHCIIGRGLNGMQVDHVNRDRLDNRRANLRFVTNQENCLNSGPKTGRFKGVSWKTANRKWVAQIFYDGVKHHVGVFDDEVEAARAWNEAARLHHGKFAFQNQVERDDGQ
ncbi:MAG: hypothetical protein GY722_27780 [bacterium]|nr:hypothetical protein [bacterium]